MSKNADTSFASSSPFPIRLNMKIQTVCVGAVLALLTSVPCEADTYSVTLTTPTQLIANHLDRGNNLLSDVLPEVPDGTTVWVFDDSSQLYLESTSFFGGGLWLPEDYLFPPGKAVFIQVPVVPYTLVFSGTPPAPSTRQR